MLQTASRIEYHSLFDDYNLYATWYEDPLAH